ncbi:hypothetical protein RUND412_011332 [Rhizina undulata]
MTSTRPPNNRTLSSHSEVQVLESPSLTTSASSTPSSTHNDQDPMDQPPAVVQEQTVIVSRADGDITERGRTPTVIREEYGEEDARSMSPRRNSEEIERLGSEAKAMLEQQAQALQSGLLALLDRVEKVREEHDKLEDENRFLQEYIGSLMATSKITGGGSGSGGNRGRNSSRRLK